LKVIERILHQDATNTRASGFLGRQDILQQMVDFCDSPQQPGPLVVHGGAGSGKSALIARFIQVRQQLLIKILKQKY
jgi:type II secretory ATPase GspE/PulE/Tfp pilus assembly ATPase PilB-like protein